MVIIVATITAAYLFFTRSEKLESRSYTLTSHLLFESKEGILVGNFTAILRIVKMDSSINSSLTLMLRAPENGTKVEELTMRGFFYYFVYDLAKPPPPIPPPRPYRLTIEPGRK